MKLKEIRIQTLYFILDSKGKSVDWSINKGKAESLAENLSLLNNEKYSVSKSVTRHEILKHKK